MVICTVGDGPAVTSLRATPDRGGPEDSSLLGAIGLGEGSLEVRAGLETISRGLEANVMVDVTTTGAAKRESTLANRR